MEFYDGKNTLTAPDPFGDLGELNLRLYETPVSMQGNANKKREFKGKIQDLTSQFEHIIAGDIQVEITWFTPEQERYEYSSFSDLDNIIKVLLDGLSGPDGLYVDDCLVQHFSVTWIDTGEEEHVDISVRYSSVHSFPKSDYVFFHLGKRLCLPVYKRLPIEVLERISENFEKRNKIIEETGEYYKAIGLMNAQRLFHRNKLNNFEVLEYQELVDLQSAT